VRGATGFGNRPLPSVGNSTGTECRYRPLPSAGIGDEWQASYRRLPNGRGRRPPLPPLGGRGLPDPPVAGGV
jgi:hypothetical protein